MTMLTSPDSTFTPTPTSSSSSSTSQPIKLAILGGGLIGPRHAQAIHSIPSKTAILSALIDPAPHGPSIAASLKTTHYTSISSLLSSSGDQKPDAAIICTPNHTHVPLALELIDAGIHVLVEKPVCTTIPDGIKLIKSAKEKGVKVLVGHHRRFNPYLLAAKRCLETQQKLGQIIAIQGTWCLQKPPSYFNGIGEWRRDRKNGGVIWINLIHEIDLLQYLLGPIEYVSAIETKKTRGFEAEEGAAVILRFESGVVGTFILSDAVPSPWNFEAGTGENPTVPFVNSDAGAGGFYRIMGTKGSLSVPDLTLWNYENCKEEKGWLQVLNKEELGVDRDVVPFEEQMRHFVEVVKGEKEPNCSGEEALRAMVVCEAVKRSLEIGKGVRIVGFELREE